MNIAIITSYPCPHDSATSNRVLSFASALNKSHNETTIICPNTKNKKDIPLDLNFTFVKTLAGSPKNIFVRAVFEFINAVRLCKNIRKNTSRIVITIPSPLLILILVVAPNAKIIVDIRDNIFGYLKAQTKLNTLLFVITLVEKVFNFLLKKAYLIIVTNEFEQSYFKKLGISTVIIKNGLDGQKFKILSNIECSNHCDTYTKILYYGNIGQAQGLAPVILAAAENPKIELRLIGSGKLFSSLEKLINKKEIRNVTLIKHKPWGEILIEIEKADILLGCLSAAFVSAIPSKIFEYVSTGKPSLFYFPEGAASEVAKKFPSAFHFDYHEVSMLSRHVATIKNEFSCYKGIKSRGIVEQEFLRETIAKEGFKCLDW